MLLQGSEGNDQSKLTNNQLSIICGQRDLFYTRGNSGLFDLASHTTLPSDSSPFHEKYEIDEDAEPIGEVRLSFEDLLVLYTRGENREKVSQIIVIK